MEKKKCELCNFDMPSTLITDDTTFILCPNHLKLLIDTCLPKKEALQLIKTHGNETFYLHEDFYDEKGYALQPA